MSAPRVVPFGVLEKRPLIPSAVAIPALVAAIVIGAPGFIFTQNEIGQFFAPVAAPLSEAWQQVAQSAQNFSIKLPIVGEALAADREETKDSKCIALAGHITEGTDLKDGVYFDLASSFRDIVCINLLAVPEGTMHWNGFDAAEGMAAPSIS